MSDDHVKDPREPADEQIWAELRAIEREARQGDNGRLLDQLAAGTLTPGDEKKLRALAARDPEFALLVQAHEPLGNEWRQRVTDQIAASMTSTEPAEPGSGDAGPVGVSRVRELRPSSPWGSRAKPLWLRPQFWAPALAVAALFVVVALGLGDATSIPTYGLEFSGGASETRSPTAAPGEGQATVPRLAVGSRFEVLLRPERQSDGPVESRVYVTTAGRLTRPTLRPETSESGALRFRGQVGRDLGLGAGEHRLVFVVAPQGELPSDEFVAEALSSAHASDDFQLLTQRLVVREDP